MKRIYLKWPFQTNSHLSFRIKESVNIMSEGQCKEEAKTWTERRGKLEGNASQKWLQIPEGDIKSDVILWWQDSRISSLLISSLASVIIGEIDVAIRWATTVDECSHLRISKPCSNMSWIYESLPPVASRIHEITLLGQIVSEHLPIAYLH